LIGSDRRLRFKLGELLFIATAGSIGLRIFPPLRPMGSTKVASGNT
jgi:hypothetical protein